MFWGINLENALIARARNHAENFQKRNDLFRDQGAREDHAKYRARAQTARHCVVSSHSSRASRRIQSARVSLVPPTNLPECGACARAVCLPLTMRDDRQALRRAR